MHPDFLHLVALDFYFTKTYLGVPNVFRHHSICAPLIAATVAAKPNAMSWDVPQLPFLHIYDSLRRLALEDAAKVALESSSDSEGSCSGDEEESVIASPGEGEEDEDDAAIEEERQEGRAHLNSPSALKHRCSAAA